MSSEVQRVLLDQFHWVQLAKVLKAPRVADPLYGRIFELATDLQQAGRVSFPLSADRYHETLRTSQARQRIDVAQAMARLSKYETMLQLDRLTLLEIEAALSQLVPDAASAPIEVFGHGIMHAFGAGQMTDHLRVSRLDGVPLRGTTALIEEQVRAVARESFGNSFEWACLSGDPRVQPLAPELRTRYDVARENFAAEEEKRTSAVREHGLDPRKMGYALAAQLHIDGLLRTADQLGVAHELIPLDSDPVAFFQTIPTVHVLAELLAARYRNPQKRWKDGDWADMRAICEGVVYCDAIAPDKDWAHTVKSTDLAARYDTVVLRDAKELLAYLQMVASD